MGTHRRAKTTKFTTKAAGVGAAAVGLAVLTGLSPAQAAGACTSIPGHSEVLHHAALTHTTTSTTPGQPAQGYDESQWSRVVAAVSARSHTDNQYDETVQGTPAVTQVLTQLDRLNAGTPAVTHVEYRYRKNVPAVPEVDQEVTRVAREHPGTPAVTHDEYTYTQTETITVPAQGDPTIPNPDYKPAWDETVTVTPAYTDYVKWNWTAPEKGDDAPSGPPPGAGWHQVGTTNDSKGSTPDTIVHTGNGKGSYFYYQSVHHDAVTTVVHHDAVGTPTIPNPSYVPASTTNVTVYKTVGGTTQNRDDAAWFTEDSFPGWTQDKSRSVTDTPGTAPFTEYRTQDGGVTTDSSQAGFFPMTQLPELATDGWAATDIPEMQVVTPGVPAHVEYLHVADDGTQTSSLYPSGVSWVDPTKVAVGAEWESYDSMTVTDTPAVAPFTEYLAQDGSTTSDPTQAGWFDVTQLTELEGAGWQPFGDTKTVVVTPATPDVVNYLVVGADGALSTSTNPADATWVNPLVTNVTNEWTAFNTREVVDSPAVPEYTVYFVPNGDPTLTLSDVNWTTESPANWTLVDTRFVITVPAQGPVTVKQVVVDHPAWNETVVTPASNGTCTNPVSSTQRLASTGANVGPLGLVAVVVVLVGGGLLVIARRRRGDEQS